MPRRDERRRRILNLAWLACIVVGPWLFFECGNYYGQVKAYREEHERELYLREQKDRATGLAEYAYETGQSPLLLPLHLKKLEHSEDLYGALTFVWVFATVGVWRTRRHAQWCAIRYERNAPCNCGGQWWKENPQS